MVADEILGGLRPSWERRNFAWTCDAVSLSCLGYADDVLLFSGSKASLETMIEDCCMKFGEAGLEVGLDKTHWSSSIAMDGETLAVRGQSIVWERKLEFIGSVIEPGAHSGGAVRHRTQKASSVFCKWKPLLCNPNLSLKERMTAFGASTLSSATWLSGCWTLSKQQEQASESWCARLLSQMVGFKRNPNDDVATSGRSFTVRVTIWPEFSLSAQLICTFALNTVSRGILPVLRATILCIRCWCAGIWLGGVRNNAYGARRSLVELTRRGSTHGAGNRVWSGRTGVRGWSVVETHGQWVGLRLRRTNGSGKLVKAHFSPAVGMDVDVAAVVESRKCAPMSNGFLDVRHWELVESYGLQTLCECHERRFGYPAVVHSGKIAVLERTLAGNRVLEKELEKLQKNNGPKKTAKHIEAKQNRINRESKRLEVETVRLTELQESLRARKETFKVTYEEIKILREDLLREGESMDKKKVSGGHGGNSETRATGTGVLERVGFEETSWLDTRRFVGGSRWLDDGSPEAQQRRRSKEEKIARDDREGVKERCQNGRRCHGWSGWFSVVMRVRTRKLQAIFEWKRFEEEKEFRTVECCDRSSVLESVELERGWFGRGLYRHFPVADFDAHRLGCVARMFQKTGWSERWCTRLVHAWEDCDVRRLSSIENGKDNRRLSGVRQDGLR